MKARRVTATTAFSEELPEQKQFLELYLRLRGFRRQELLRRLIAKGMHDLGRTNGHFGGDSLEGNRLGGVRWLTLECAFRRDDPCEQAFLELYDGYRGMERHDLPGRLIRAALRDYGRLELSEIRQRIS